jgi:hypothetical protein
MGLVSVGYRQTTGAAAAKTMANLAPGGVIPDGAIHAVVQCETQNCRWIDDGSGTPTSTVGMLLATGNTIVVLAAQFSRFKIIEVAASTVLNVTFYK